MVWVEIFRIYSIQALSFLPCFFCLSVSHLCLPLSISFFVCVCMCLSEPFFIYLCPTLFDSTYLYFYFCLSPFLRLHYQISWIIKLCIGISPPSPHTNENVPDYHTMSLSRLYRVFFVITIGLSVRHIFPPLLN